MNDSNWKESRFEKRRSPGSFRRRLEEGFRSRENPENLAECFAPNYESNGAYRNMYSSYYYYPIWWIAPVERYLRSLRGRNAVYY